MNNHGITRRLFLTGAAAALAAGCSTRQTRTSAYAILHTKSPNEKLNIAAIGVGGKGSSDVDTCDSENIVALCDVDWRNAGGTFERYPQAKRFKDFRRMLDECPEIDAVTISTPDHFHAFAALECMKRKKHVYVQKPLAHTVHEARLLREAAHRYGVATQMGNQGAATDMHCEVCEMIQAGMIGPVREVHSWTDRPQGWWPQGMSEILPEESIPAELDWELWLGPAPSRAYNHGYCPFNWRGWWDFGSGALGDIACHSLSPVVKALRLEYPTQVECLHLKDDNRQTYPNEAIIRYDFPRRGHAPALTLTWYDGLLKPKPAPGLIQDERILQEKGGTLFIGDRGVIVMDGRRAQNRLIVDGKVVETVEKPAPTLPRPSDRFGFSKEEKPDADRMHKLDWIHSCKTGSASGSNFDHAGPLTEWVVMGNIALRYPHRKLAWDGERMRFRNLPEANRYVTKEYRPGWEVG